MQRTLTVPGTLDSLEPVADFVLDVAHDSGLNDKATYKLRLAVDEIVTNIIEYGYAEVVGEVYLVANLDEKALTIEVEDTAPAFDPTHADVPEIDDTSDDRRLGGWGVLFAFRSVDKFMYERADGRNRNIFVVQCKPENLGGAKTSRN